MFQLEHIEAIEHTGLRADPGASRNEGLFQIDRALYDSCTEPGDALGRCNFLYQANVEHHAPRIGLSCERTLAGRRISRPLFYARRARTRFFSVVP